MSSSKRSSVESRVGRGWFAGAGASASANAGADRIARLREDLEHPSPAVERKHTQINLEAANRGWRQESDEVARALRLYTSYRASTRRIVEAAPRLTTLSARDPRSPTL